MATKQKWTEELPDELMDNYFKYFENTSVHGLKYLTEPRRPWPERVLWFFGVTVGLAACIYLIFESWSEWRTYPIIIQQNTCQQPVWEIPFPAVTICPSYPLNSPQCFDYVDFVNKHSEHRTLSPEPKIHNPENQKVIISPLVVYKERKLNHTNSTVIDRVQEFVSLKNDIVEILHLNPLTEIELEPVLTESGLCYTFNMKPDLFIENETFDYWRKNKNGDWDPVSGYTNVSKSDSYPYRALGAGKKAGLFLQLKTNLTDTDHQSWRNGFEVLLHSPIEYPQPNRKSILVSLNSNVDIAVTPAGMHPSKDMQSYAESSTPEQRKCLFPKERQLRFFQYYTQSNCKLECLANATFWECKCVEFYMPHHRSMPICKQDKQKCVKTVIERINWERPSGEHGATDPHCGCVQTCTYLHYKVETSSRNLDQYSENLLLESSHNRSKIKTESPTRRSLITIYFEDSHYLPLQRKPLRDTLEILANVGGFMGLCMGMSLLSVIELFYWILIRPCCQRIKQSNPQLRSVKKAIAQKVEASVQYSRQFDNAENSV